jgi:DNA-binding response OmpR family regulator
MVPSKSGNSSPAKILVAEDAVDLRDALVEVLLALDYTVQAARDGYEAVTMFPEFKPDLAILDMRMPMMNGIDVCAVIRQTSDIPIIMFTSADDVADVNGAILKGATDFVLKTTGINELADRVEAHLQRELEPLKPRVTVAPPGTTPLLPNVHTSTGSRNAFKSFTVVIDPDKKSRARIIGTLKRLNQDFIEVETAAEGALAIERHDPDIVVTEWQLPDMDAFKMFSELKRGDNAKEIARVIMSDRLSPETLRKSNFVGISNILEKPLNVGKVEVMVGDCVRTALNNLKRNATPAA